MLLRGHESESGVPTPLPENVAHALDHHIKLNSKVWSLWRPSLILFWVEESKDTTNNVILIILVPVSCIFCYFVRWPTYEQLFFYKLSHSYMFRHYRVILRELVINTLQSYKNISSAAVGNTIHLNILIVNCIIVNCITNSCFWNSCVTWQGIDYKLPE